MTDERNPQADERVDRRNLVRETHATWERRAAIGDDLAPDNHHRLVMPALDGLLAPSAGERILEIACGTGALARHISSLGAEVVATDFAETYIARARKFPQPAGRHIDYRVVDATDEKALKALGRHAFHAAVCNMSLSDIATIDPLFRAVPYLLAPGGRFVFTIPHPGFNHGASRIVAVTDHSGDEPATAFALSIDRYLRVPDSRGRLALTPPGTTLTFHRPLSEILNAAFNAGLVMDGIAEPAYPASSSGGRQHSWANLPDIPPILAARFRPGGGVDR
jgi:2-polyprenyl-3-methyl-5-hydroxy-6-metoxy-1,4-benzoquinol methylase